MEKGKMPTAVTLGGIPATDLGTGELLVLEVVKALCAYADKYELDPAREHVVLMYGKPYITIDGYYYHAFKTGTAFKVESQPLNEQERRDYQIGEGTHVWRAKITIVNTGAFYTGLGIVTQEEMIQESKNKPGQLRAPVVAKHPWQLAQKRAEWQALRRAFPIGETEEVKEEP